MNDEEFMYVLEAMAYISATIAAFVYVWETCSPTKKQQLKKSGSNSNLMPKKIISKNRRSSSSLYDDF